MKLYTHGSNNGWNEFLTNCVNSLSINELARVRYSLQAGMTDIANQKLNDEKINIFYARLMKSIENAARQILRIKHPMPHDIFIHGDGKYRPKTALEAKRKRDKELKDFFTNSSF